MNKLLLLFLLSIALHTSISAQVIYSQDFESGSLPTGWQNVSKAIDGGWNFSSTIASSDDLKCNCDKSNDMLITAPINLSGYPKLIMKMDLLFQGQKDNGTTESFTILGSDDGGITWVDMAQSNGTEGWDTFFADLSGFAGKSNVMFAFKFSDNGGWLNGVGIDNIKIQVPLDRDVKFKSTPSELVAKSGASKTIEGIIKNEGSETLHSITITANVGNKQWKETFNGLNIPAYTSAGFEMTQPAVIEKGEKELTLTLSNPNGLGDQDLLNNETKINLRGLDLLRPVVVEEATGTWCGFCVRGQAYMKIMTETYPDNFIGIAVHNSDPMVLEAYDNGLNCNSFPSVKVNRDTFMDPKNMEVQFLDMAAVAPTADISAKAIIDKNTRVLTVTASSTTTKTEIASKFFAALVEEGVTGTTSDYDQSNYYSGGGLGAMYGFENLPNPVPASQMIYDHVGRALLAGFNGATGSIKTPWKPNTLASYTFPDYTIPAEYNLDNLHVVVGILNASNRFINVMKAPLEEAVGTDNLFTSNSITLTPNPCADITYAEFEVPGKTATVNINVYNSIGKLVISQDFGKLTGKQRLPVKASDLSNGIYFMQINIDGDSATKQLVINR